MEDGKRPIHNSSLALTLETSAVDVELAPIAVFPTNLPQSCLHAVVDQGVCWSGEVVKSQTGYAGVLEIQ